VSSSLTPALETGNRMLGLSGELLVATVAKEAAEKEQWLWTITALKRDHRDSLASADFHNEASQKDAVKRSRLANHSSFLRCSPACKRSRERCPS
jgi:hypothetical protein